ncbi:hypothetical protein ASG92_10295 [Arthrobacter sp. Soil736]|uniref:hypothetical protein n=1 Tax=Arthrobacter sp. Soil736 TaxID=1736395 RepID=UPI0006F1DDFF|nr:hypothetical protein [Arthrobacter sp. Soil736]KRE47612.1 hypothetical protein ASG92_10295 [Arthrobacter sp. Soil736]
MTAAAHRTAAAFLGRAGLVAAVLAIIAGVFGMHILTGSHAVHAPASAAAAGTATVHTESAATDGHAEHGVANASPAHLSSSGHNAPSVLVEECSCSDSCAGMPTMMVSCTPLGKTGSLCVPLPGTAVFGGISNAGAPSAAPGSYSYLPGSPSPGELSISRT